jgi:hypothetical protein
MYNENGVMVWKCRQRIALGLGAVCLAIGSMAPVVNAQPIVNEVSAGEVLGQGEPLAPAVAAHTVYLPFAPRAQCYSFIPLDPTDERNLCGDLGLHVGAHTIGDIVTDVSGGAPEMFQTDMPKVRVNIPQTGFNIAPQDATGITSHIVKLSAMAYMTDSVAAAGVDAGGPMAARIAWVIRKALQDKAKSAPVLFPVSIAQLHYSQPNKAASTATIFTKCGDKLNAGQLSLGGFPYNFSADGTTATGGNIWLQMHYPACPAISSYWIRLADFYQGLKAFPEYQNIDAEANAMVGPSTYHATIPMVGLSGQQVLAAATITVIVIGAVVLIVIAPEVGVGWWLLSGTAVLNHQEVLSESGETVSCDRC